jgi:hypothetical protein
MNIRTKTLAAVGLAAAVIFGSLPASANPYNSYVDRRAASQEMRVQEAWQSGCISPGEYRRLVNQQQRLRQVESRMRADGRLSPGEKTRLNEMLNHSERAIQRGVHNNWRPGPHRAHWRPGCRPVNWRPRWR